MPVMVSAVRWLRVQARFCILSHWFPTMREFECEDLSTLGGLGRHTQDPSNSVPVPTTCQAPHLYSGPTSSEISDLTGLRASALSPMSFRSMIQRSRSTKIELVETLGLGTANPLEVNPQAPDVLPFTRTCWQLDWHLD